MEEKSDLRKGSTHDSAKVMVKSFQALKGKSLDDRVPLHLCPGFPQPSSGCLIRGTRSPLTRFRLALVSSQPLDVFAE